MELWNLPAPGVVFRNAAAAARYPICINGSVGSAVLVNTTLNTSTVAYYNGTTSGSSACFVCDEGNELNTTAPNTERVCQNDATWSGSPITCGMQ